MFFILNLILFLNFKLIFSWLLNNFPNPLNSTLECGDYRNIMLAQICDPNNYLKYEELYEYI